MAKNAGFDLHTKDSLIVIAKKIVVGDYKSCSKVRYNRTFVVTGFFLDHAVKARFPASPFPMAQRDKGRPEDA